MLVFKNNTLKIIFKNKKFFVFLLNQLFFIQPVFLFKGICNIQVNNYCKIVLVVGMKKDANRTMKDFAIFLYLGRTSQFWLFHARSKGFAPLFVVFVYQFL